MKLHAMLREGAVSTAEVDALTCNRSADRWLLSSSCLSQEPLLLTLELREAEIEFMNSLGGNGRIVVGVAEENTCACRGKLNLQIIELLVCAVDIRLGNVVHGLGPIQHDDGLQATLHESARPLQRAVGFALPGQRSLQGSLSVGKLRI